MMMMTTTTMIKGNPNLFGINQRQRSWKSKPQKLRKEDVGAIDQCQIMIPKKKLSRERTATQQTQHDQISAQ